MTGYKIKKIYTPNQFGRKGWIPDIIVSHITEGDYLGAIEWLTNEVSQASAHFVVSQKGEITQLVDIEEAGLNGRKYCISNFIYCFDASGVAAHLLRSAVDPW